MARTLEQITAMQLGGLNFQVLSLTAQCEKQQDEIKALTDQLAAAKTDDVKPLRAVKA